MHQPQLYCQGGHIEVAITQEWIITGHFGGGLITWRTIHDKT